MSGEHAWRVRAVIRVRSGDRAVELDDAGEVEQAHEQAERIAELEALP